MHSDELLHLMDLADAEHRAKYPDWSNRDNGRKRVLIHNGGELVGFYSPYKSGKYWRTGTIYVKPEHRGKGIGTKVINDFFSQKEHGLAYIEPTNLGSLGAFKKAGFKEAKRKIFWQEENEPTEYIQMVKEPNKYLDHIEKQSSLIAGAAGTHVAQNLATRAALSSKKVSKYLANSFAEGTKGVVNTSLKARAARLIAGATVPDLAVAHKTAHEFGKAMSPILKHSTKRQQVGLRMLSEGRISDIHKYGLHKDPVIQAAHGIASAKLGLKNGVDDLVKHAPKIEALFKDKSHPLASNILKNISRGHDAVGKHFKPGSLNSKAPLLGAAASVAADPAGGALNTVKTLATSNTFGKTRIGAKINSFLENQFVKKPVQAGVETSKLGNHISNLKHKAMGTLVNPVSAQLKRTSAALTDALK